MNRLERTIPAARLMPPRAVPDASPRRDTYMTVAEVADRWRVAKMTVYRLVESGDLRAIRIARNIRIPTSIVVQFERSADTWGKR